MTAKKITKVDKKIPILRFYILHLTKKKKKKKKNQKAFRITNFQNPFTQQKLKITFIPSVIIIYVCVCVCVYIYIYIHTHIYIYKLYINLV